MITLSRSLVRTIRIVVRRALTGSSRGHVSVPIEILSDTRGCRIRAKSDLAAIEYRDLTEQPQGSLAVPFSLLTDCEGSSKDPVQFDSAEDGQVSATWTDGSVPQIATHAAEDPYEDFPTWPADNAENGPNLLDALHDCMQTTDVEAVRYTTNCVQLRGSSGSVAATDGRQLLVQSGFTFPWSEDVLVPRTTVFGSKQLQCAETVWVGRRDDWIAVRSGPWTIWLAIHQDGRFPPVDDHIGKPETAASSLRVSDPDATFLNKSLESLPGDKEHNSPVTLDLNGAAIVRAKSPERPQPVELMLSNSRTTGDNVRLNTDRHYLQRAMKLGFRDVYLFKQDTPVLCQDERRSYVWAPLTAAEAVKPSEDAVRIESPACSATSRPAPPKTERTRTTVAKSRTTHVEKPATNGKSESNEVGVEELLQQSEQLKVSLRHSLAKTTQLISGLKQHKKQAKLVQSTLDSLKRLPGVGTTVGK